MNRYILPILIMLAFAGTLPAKNLGVDIALVTTSGTVASNAKNITFIFSSDFTGTVAGVAFNGGTDASLNIPASQLGDILGTISYTVTTGNIRIVRTQ